MTSAHSSNPQREADVSPHGRPAVARIAYRQTRRHASILKGDAHKRTQDLWGGLIGQGCQESRESGKEDIRQEAASALEERLEERRQGLERGPRRAPRDVRPGGRRR